MKYKLVIFLSIVLLLNSCKKDENLASFISNNQKIEDSNENLNIKNESFLEAIYIQADKNDDLIPRKETAKKVHAIGVDLYKYIEDLKVVIKEKNTTEFVNELFFNGDELTTEGKEFLSYIKNYRDSMNATLQNTNPRIVGMVNNNFKLSEYEDRRGKKTDWLTIKFKDFSPIISITTLSNMQYDIRRIETQYLAELLGVKLNTSVRKIVDNIKKESEKQISQNQKVEEVDTPVISETDKEAVVQEKEAISNEIAKTNVEEPIVKEEPVVKEEVKIEEPKKITPKVVAKKTHTVKSGENLYRISLKYKMSADKIKKLNGMRNNNIVVGQVLKLE
jgi:LysM repeat protein